MDNKQQTKVLPNIGNVPEGYMVVRGPWGKQTIQGTPVEVTFEKETDEKVKL
jgi:hypothetical protein